MFVAVDIKIDRTKESVWQTITDIENCQNVISSILKISILNKPENDLVGLRWEETRKMFGKEAMETMWVTDSAVNEYYATRAESHGSVYITKLSLEESDGSTLLTMSFNGIPQTFAAKIISFFMRPLINSSIKKAMVNDLLDIKAYVEKS